MSEQGCSLGERACRVPSQSRYRVEDKITMFSRRKIVTAGSVLAGAGLSHAVAQSPAGGTSRRVFNVLDYGAVADDGTMNTAAFKRASDACAGGGGGVLYVPPGAFLTGPVNLGSNTVLYLEAGAVIKGSPKLADYRAEQAPTSGESVRSGLVTARNANNVAICGRGVIEGNGMAFQIAGRIHQGNDWDRKFTRQKNEYMDPKFGTETGPFAHEDRPGNLVRFLDCTNVLVEGVTIQNSPTWTVQFNRCADVNVRGVNINSDASDRRIGNDDGMDFRDSENIRVSDCNIHTGDDCIAVFASRNLTVSNCTLAARSAGIRVGYMGGETRHCVFENLVIHSNCGLKVNVRGSGLVEDILFSNIVKRTGLITGHWWGKGEPANVSAVPGSERAQAELGHIRRIRFSNILAESENSFLLYGSPGSPIEDVLIENVELRMHNSRLQPSYGGNFDLRGAADFAHALFQHDAPGLFFRHVQGLRIRGLRLFWDDIVPEFFSHGIEGEEFRDVDVRGFEGRGANGRAAIALRNGADVTIADCRATAGCETFLSQTGVSDQRLFLNNDLTAVRRPFEPAAHGFTLSGNLLPKS